MACMKDGFVEGLILDGRFKAISPLNHGSFGMVFLAQDLQTGNRVAVKCVSKSVGPNGPGSLDIDEHSLERSCHRQLGHHPHIVNLLHTFESKAHIYLVLEYCSVGDLYEAIRIGRGPMETKNVRDFMLQLVSAVEYMHDKGFYHRDIKPENIFLTQDGSMKLGDLGLATSDAWSHEASVGSDRYMAPEQYAPEEHGYSPAKADIWAIGICLLNVLFARNPFVTPTESDVLFADFARDNQSLFDVFPNMSQDTYEVLKHAMATDPTKRSLSGMKEALEKVVDFTTDEEVFDDFCTEARSMAPLAANREPLRTPSISSPQVDQNGTFPWSKILHTTPPRQVRQLSTVADTESYSEDLFSLSDKGRDSWYSVAQNSSMTSGLDSAFGTSFKSLVLQPPIPRKVQHSKPIAVPVSLPSRVPTLSSIFGKKGTTVSKSWTDIWDEDEEAENDAATKSLNELSNDSTTVLNAQLDSPETKFDLDQTITNALSSSDGQIAHRRSADSLSDNEVFVFEEGTCETSPVPSDQSPESPNPKRSHESPLSRRNIMDKWAALGNRRRAFNTEAETSHEIKNKWMNTRDWRAGFGLKVFSSNNPRTAGYAVNRKETADVKVRNWRHLTPHAHSQQGAAADVEWVGGL